MNGKVFINYRREDTAPYAGRLYDRLTAHFGQDQVFIDIDQIEPGEDFVEAINRKVATCDVAIITIGPNWLRATDASGKRRLDDAEDFVRMEIVAALQRKIRVVPVLVGGAQMAGRHDLPEALAPLSRRNAIELSETRFHADVNRLIEAIEKSLAAAEKEAELSANPVAVPVSLSKTTPQFPTRAAPPELDSRADRSQRDSIATAKEPTPPLKSAQTTLIITFIRNMLLNWPVLISWVAAAILIPRFYLAAINLQPNWPSGGPAMDVFNYAQITDQIKHFWDICLYIFVAVGGALIAVAMAYAIIDLPSTGNARLPQGRFLKFRQLPLLLAALVLSEWWALFRNVHGSEPFQAGEWLPKFVAFFIASYLCGGVLALAILWFRKRNQKEARGRPTHSLWQLNTLALAAGVAGLCLWSIATGMFLEPPIQFTLSRDCEATPIPVGKQKTIIPIGTRGIITQIESSYIIENEGQKGRISEKDFGSLELKPYEMPPIQYTLKHECEAIPIPWSRQKMKFAAGTHVVITQIQRMYVIEIAQGRARITDKDVDALQLKTNQKLPERFPLPAPASNTVKYVCFAPAMFLAVLLIVNYLFTGLTSWVTEDDRKWWRRSAAWILIMIFGWTVINVIVLLGAQAISATPNRLGVFLGDVKATPVAKNVLGAFGVTGIVSALLAIRFKLR
jgi:hypothetical protein